jgi:hypothetical protein
MTISDSKKMFLRIRPDLSLLLMPSKGKPTIAVTAGHAFFVELPIRGSLITFVLVVKNIATRLVYARKKNP